MITPKYDYEICKEKISELRSKQRKLEENEAVLEYIKVSNELKDTIKEGNDLYKAMRLEKINNCKHVLVITKTNANTERGNEFIFKCCGCMKCNVDEKVAKCLPSEIDSLSLEEQIQYDYLHKHGFALVGTNTEIECDLKTAHLLYNKIESENPNIDDLNLINLFKIAYAENKNAKVKQKNINE